MFPLTVYIRNNPASLAYGDKKKLQDKPIITKKSFPKYVKQKQSFSQTQSPSERKYASSCFIKVGTAAYLAIIAKFYWVLILQNDRKIMWQKQQQVGSHMACAPFVNFIWMKIWKRSRRVLWTKLPSSIIQGTPSKWRILNLGQKVWKAFKCESSRRVLIVHLHVTVVKLLRKTLTAIW